MITAYLAIAVIIQHRNISDPLSGYSPRDVAQIKREVSLQEKLANLYKGSHILSLVREGSDAIREFDAIRAVSPVQTMIRLKTAEMIGRAALRSGSADLAAELFDWASRHGARTDMPRIIRGLQAAELGRVEEARKLLHTPSTVLHMKDGAFGDYYPTDKTARGIEALLWLQAIQTIPAVIDDAAYAFALDHAYRAEPANAYIDFLESREYSRHARPAEAIQLMKAARDGTVGLLHDSLEMNVRQLMYPKTVKAPAVKP